MQCDRSWTAWALLTSLALAGCRSGAEVTFDDRVADCRPFLQQIEYPDACLEPDAGACEALACPPPTVRRLEELEYVPVTLEEAVRMALADSEVIRQAGGRIIYSPAAASSVLDPAIVETDPNLGTQAALAAFDAELFAGLHNELRDRRYNNQYLGTGAFTLAENLGEFSFGISKTAATGTRFVFANTTYYNRNDSPVNLYTSAYDVTYWAGVRHPLLQGGGLEFNRIAGPSGAPGNYRGVLIARLNGDIALSEFETAVQNLLREVEQAYWQLYFAYRDLDAKLEGRRYALESWQLEQQRVAAQMRPADQEAYAREQYYAAQAAVENALSGHGASPGVFGAERELRALLGLPASDGRVLRPSTPPLRTDIVFDWEESLGYSLQRRVELRQQRWRVKQRELELIAARNLQRPRLDFVGQYNWVGFGDELLGNGDTAYNDLFHGDLQGWRVGFELQTPFGQRLGRAAVSNAELRLRRDQALLQEQERQVSLELRAAFTELDRAYAVTRSNYNRHVAARIQFDAERKRNSVGETRLDLVLEAQRRTILAEIDFHRAEVDYNLAVSKIHFARGTLLDSLQVQLTEGAWSEGAYASAVREARRFQGACLRRLAVLGPVSGGAYPQGGLPEARGLAPVPDAGPEVGETLPNP